MDTWRERRHCDETVGVLEGEKEKEKEWGYLRVRKRDTKTKIQTVKKKNEPIAKERVEQQRI